AAFNQNGAGDHPRPGIIARATADEDQAAAHPLAQHGAGLAADAEPAAPHAEILADDKTARPVARVAGDLDRATGHGSAGKRAGRAAHSDGAAAHERAEIGAGVAVDD